MSQLETGDQPAELVELGEEFAHLGQTLYTVVGFYENTEQRFAEQIWTASARLAEDLIMTEHGTQVVNGVRADLRICGVLEVVDGQIRAADTYACFLDPDRVPDQPL